MFINRELFRSNLLFQSRGIGALQRIAVRFIFALNNKTTQVARNTLDLSETNRNILFVECVMPGWPFTGRCYQASGPARFHQGGYEWQRRYSKYLYMLVSFEMRKDLGYTVWEWIYVCLNISQFLGILRHMNIKLSRKPSRHKYCALSP